MYARNDHSAWLCDASLSTSQTCSLSCGASDTAFCHNIPAILSCYEKKYRGDFPDFSIQFESMLHHSLCQQYANQTSSGITD